MKKLVGIIFFLLFTVSVFADDTVLRYHTYSLSYAVSPQSGITWLCDAQWHSITVPIPHGIKILGGHIDGGISSLWADIYVQMPNGDLLADIHKLSSQIGWDGDHITDYFRAPYYMQSASDTVNFAGWCGPAETPPTPNEMVVFNAYIYYQ